MNKSLVFALALSIITPVSMLNAALVGNIAGPAVEKGKTGFSVGVESDFVFERKLDVPGEDVKFEANSYAAKLSYTIAERAGIYALLGTLSNGEVTEEVGSIALKYGIDDAFVWGVGATVLVYEWDNGLRIGIDGKYRASEPDVSTVSLNGVDYAITDTEGSYKDWQIALAVSKQLGKFIPYAGVKYSDVEVSAKTTIAGTVYQTNKINSKDVIGVFVGASLVAADNISINVEGRFIDEAAVSFACTYKF